MTVLKRWARSLLPLIGAAILLTLPARGEKRDPRARSETPRASKGSAAQLKSAKKTRSARHKSTPTPKKQTKARKPRSKKLKSLSSYGPISVGHPHAGFLVNSVQLPEHAAWVRTIPSHAYGTQETVDSLSHCIKRVRREFPGAPPVMLGSLSGEHGGRLPPHKSHRTGRDADVYFFRTKGAKWVRAAKSSDIDLPRTWALLRCFITDTDVDMILIDRKPQSWLKAYALSIGEPAKWIEGLFHDRKPYHRSVVRHVPGHVAHMHVRFVSPKARRLGLKLYDRLVTAGRVTAPRRAMSYRVKKGDTLSGIAARFKTSVRRIKRSNRLKGSLIRTGQTLTIHVRVELKGARGRVVVPARRLPPAASENTSASAPSQRNRTIEPRQASCRCTGLGSQREPQKHYSRRPEVADESEAAGPSLVVGPVAKRSISMRQSTSRRSARLRARE